MNKNIQNFIFSIVCIISFNFFAKQFIPKYTLTSETNIKIYGKTDLIYVGLDRYVKFYIKDDLLVIHYLDREYKEYKRRSLYLKNTKIERDVV
jgi:hypothetical protein